MPCLDSKAHDYKLRDGLYVCQRPGCGHVSSHQPMPSQAELWEENKRLTELIKRCRKYIEDAIEYVQHDEHIIAKRGKELLEALDKKA